MEINKLFYELYKEVLQLYYEKTPKIYLRDEYKLYDKGKEKGYNSTQKVHLIPNSYFHEYRKEVKQLPSFTRIIEFFSTNIDLVKGNIFYKEGQIKNIQDSLGGYVFLVAETLFIKYNCPILAGTKWNFSPIAIEQFLIDDTSILNLLNGVSDNKSDYFFLNNFEIPEDIELDKSQGIILKKLSIIEKECILNSSQSFGLDIHERIFSVNTALWCKNSISAEVLNNYLSLFRLYAAGEFQYFALGKHDIDPISNSIYFHINTYYRIEKPLIDYPFITQKAYKITIEQVEGFKQFISENYDKINLPEFDFSKECLSQIHGLDYKYRIPFIFFILESFFKNVRSELSFRLKFIIAKLLEKPYNFSETIKKLYDIRSDIVHGNIDTDIIKNLRKIKLGTGNNLNSLEEAAIYLENIMRELWIKILTAELYNVDMNIEEYIYNKEINTPNSSSKPIKTGL